MGRNHSYSFMIIDSFNLSKVKLDRSRGGCPVHRLSAIPDASSMVGLCSDRDEDCDSVEGKYYCWLYDRSTGFCPYLINKN